MVKIASSLANEAAKLDGWRLMPHVLNTLQSFQFRLSTNFPTLVTLANFIYITICDCAFLVQTLEQTLIADPYY